MLCATGNGVVCPVAIIGLGPNDAESRDFLSPAAALFCLLPLSTAKLLMASLPLWSKCYETRGDTGSKSTHPKEKQTGQALAAHLSNFSAASTNQGRSLWWVEPSLLLFPHKKNKLLFSLDYGNG